MSFDPSSWNVARWFFDPIGSLGNLLSRSGSNSDKFDFSFGELGNTLKGVWDDWTGNTANRENIEYQKEYNEQVFNSAATHYQTVVADLRKAGLSAQLAAGSPSTIAGAAQSPQRTVGNESAAIERLVGLVNAIKQTQANVTLSSAQTDAAKAEAADKTADAALKGMQLGDYSERMSIDMALKKSQTEYNNALTQIAMLDGQTYMQRFQANIDEQTSRTWYNRALANLSIKDLEVRDSQIALNNSSAQVNYAQKDEIRHRIENLKEEKKNLQLDFYNKVKQGLHLDAQTALLLQQATNAKIESDVLAWNLQLSKDNGLRTTDTVSKLFGINLHSDSAVSTVTDWFKNYKGAWGLFPSWNDIFGGSNK